jgi:hypothetical protein
MDDLNLPPGSPMEYGLRVEDCAIEHARRRAPVADQMAPAPHLIPPPSAVQFLGPGANSSMNPLTSRRSDSYRSRVFTGFRARIYDDAACIAGSVRCNEDREVRRGPT